MQFKSQVKFIRSLNSRKVRDAHGIFIVEGPRAVEDMLRAPNVQPQDVFATIDWADEHGRDVEARNGSVIEVSPAELQRLSAQTTGNQVVAVFSKPVFPGPPTFKGQLSLLLEDIQDPGNIGTIIRSADWFGVTNIVCSPSCADAFSAKVVQATMGSIARVRVIVTPLEEFLEKHAEIATIGATLDGMDIREWPAVEEAFLVIGNEARGISPELLEHCNTRITIPKKGHAESLNAAVATSIILSHLCR